jgi:hypothetical protein
LISVAVGADGERPAHAGVVERRLRGVQLDERHLGEVLRHEHVHVARRRGGLELAADALGVGGVDDVGAAAALERVDAHVAVGQHPELDGIGVGVRLAVGSDLPVVLVAGRRELVVGRPALELERAGADQLAVAALGIVELRLGHDAHPARAEEERREGHPRDLGLHDDGVVDDLGALDVGEHEAEQQRVAALVGAAVGVEVVLDDLGGEVGAVVELDAVAQLDGPLGEVVVGGDGLGEVRHVLALGVGHGEGVVDGPDHHHPGDGELALRGGSSPRCCRPRGRR